jgi:hypothetical protein
MAIIERATNRARETEREEEDDDETGEKQRKHFLLSLATLFSIGA